MRKYFIPGLVILLPLALTIAIVAFIFNLLTEPFLGIFQGILRFFNIQETSFWIFTSTEVQVYISQLMILVVLFLFTVLLGMFARWYFIHSFLKFGDYIFHRIPLFNTVYKASQDVIRTIFTSDTRSFKQVVLVQFPNEETHTIGLVTREDLPVQEFAEHLVAVFVPTTPNPTSGFLLLYEKRDLIYLDMTIEDAFKYVISCGVVQTPFIMKKILETQMDKRS